MFWASRKGRKKGRRRKYAPNVVLFSFSERPLSRPILRRSFYTSQERVSAITTVSLEQELERRQSGDSLVVFRDFPFVSPSVSPSPSSALSSVLPPFSHRCVSPLSFSSG